MLRRLTVLTIIVSAIFLMLVGIPLDSQPLFYMSTVMFLTLAAMRVQAIVATRGLRFERKAPSVIIAGEKVPIRIRVWSTFKWRRSLLVITDDLPKNLAYDLDTKPLPVAPTYHYAVETHYDLRPLKRGVYKWSKIRVVSNDPLGVMEVEKVYEADPIEIVVHPAQIPFPVDLTALSGWGASLTDEGRNRGMGQEPRSVREYISGDSLRHVHWRSTARRGMLQVKEFDTGFNVNLYVALQLTSGTDVGEGSQTTLEAMCGNAAYLAEIILNRGGTFHLPFLENEVSVTRSAETRYKEICDALAFAQAIYTEPFSKQIDDLITETPVGSTVVIMLSSAEPGVDSAIQRLSRVRSVVVLIYDSSTYKKEKQRTILPSATEREFLSSIASSAIVQFIPNPFQTDVKSN